MTDILILDESLKLAEGSESHFLKAWRHKKANKNTKTKAI